MQPATLRVPGASLYYEVRGSGPILLMIAAGAGDATTYSGLYDSLTDRYTVVSYDRRGYARSPLDDPNQIFELGTHGDDIHHLLAALTSDPASVFGCSIGALIGLDLTVHHADQVRALVAHEPPVMQLISERTPNLVQLNQEQGAGEAIRQFTASIGVSHSDKAMNTGSAQVGERVEQNRAAFFKYDAGAVARYTLDIEALQATPTQIIVAGGRDGHEYFPYRCAVAMAEQLGTTVEEFPGNHAGFVDYPREFAERLRDVLDD